MSKGISIPKSPIGLSLELLLITAIAIAIVLRIINLGSREFWYDEVLSLLVATGQGVNYEQPGALPFALSDYAPLLRLPPESSIGDVIATVGNILKSLLSDVHPPLFFLSLHFWVRLFGNSEVALRSLTALFSVGAIGSAYGLGRVFIGHRGGLLLAALLATNPFFLFHSLNARMYSLLLLWTILSAWAMVQLVSHGAASSQESLVMGDEEQFDSSAITNGSSPMTPSKPNTLLWSIILIVSVAAGLLTQYLFAYWVMALGIFVLLCDRRRWWQHGLRLGAGVLLTMPWVVWGVKKQTRLGQVGAQFSKGNHLEDIAQTLGTHLVLGEWRTTLPKVAITIAGCIAIALLVACAISLWKKGEHRALKMALSLGIVPLLLPLLVDILTRKYSIGFEGGRAVLFILPGCLLLVTLWLERAAGRWQAPAVALLLLLYLGIGIGDYSIRQRQIFHQFSQIIQTQPNTSTIVAMNSRAWGHILRLAYYTPPSAPVKLLAQFPADLASALDKTLKTPQSAAYPRLIWLDSARPVNKAPKTEAEKQRIQKEIQKVLNPRFQRVKTERLSGTMNLDEFTVNLYTRSSATK